MHATTMLGLFLIVCVVPLEGQTIPEYRAVKISHALTIDGHLTEPEWATAVPTARFVHHTNGSAARLSTQAKMLWDDQYLYIGFICESPDVWATLKNRDDRLWTGEVVEVFCDPDGDGRDYAEIEINPLGTILDLMMSEAYASGGQADPSWTLNLTSAVAIDGTLNDSSDVDRGWTCEVAIPFRELAFMAPTMHFPPKEGDVWRIQLTRNDNDRKSGSRAADLSAWSPTYSNSFHVPDRFGRVIFSEHADSTAKADSSSTRN